MTDDSLRERVEPEEVAQLRAELERWKQTALRLAENAHLIPKVAGPIAAERQPVQQAVTATFLCGCRGTQGCTCPYPAEEEQ